MKYNPANKKLRQSFTDVMLTNYGNLNYIKQMIVDNGITAIDDTFQDYTGTTFVIDTSITNLVNTLIQKNEYHIETLKNF